MAEINSTITAGARTLTTFADEVSLPIIAGNDHSTVEIGVYLEKNSGQTADANGHIYARAGTVLIRRSTNPNIYNPLQTADVAGIDGSTVLVVLKADADLAPGGGMVGAFNGGTFLMGRMPSVADNAVRGLETAVRTALRSRDFKEAEQY